MKSAGNQTGCWLIILLTGFLIIGANSVWAARSVCTGTVEHCLPVADGWTFEGKVIDDNSAADVSVVQLADGQWRLYMEQMGDDVDSGFIVSYISADGLTWLPEEGRRLETNLVYDVFVIGLSDGRWRMYYLDRAGEFIGSAVSEDGLTFTDEGQCIDVGFWAEQGGTELKGVALVRQPDDSLRMYLNLNLTDGTGVVVSANSTDGLVWLKDDGIRLSQSTYCPPAFNPGHCCVIPTSDGGYSMYITMNRCGQGYSNEKPGLYELTSPDGLAFTLVDSPIVEEYFLGRSYTGSVIDPKAGVQDPVVVRTAEGLRIYFGLYDGANVIDETAIYTVFKAD